nr:putative ribonuclease H-like domain-containing protein [Tanacetum cinerariifolium]
MCDKNNSVLFTDNECLVLSPNFKLPDESQVLLRVSRENNMYNVNLKNIIPSGDLTCLFAKATIDESNLWHRRLGHKSFKTINRLVKGNLVRGLPTKVFENGNSCVACKKDKQHRASCKSKPVSFVNQPLFRLYMDLFGPTFVKSLSKKSYCLVITDDYSRFTWVFFLVTKDETTLILKTFITGLENQLSLTVKVIRSDNGIEFKNYDLTQFCGLKGIKREFSVPRTPQKNGIAERKNRTLIEAARTMLADLLHLIPFWAEAVNTACYVQNRVLVTKPYNKTPYDLLHGRPPSLGFIRPFSYPVTILNTLDHLGKFQGKETLHVNFLENKHNVAGIGPTWLFDIDSLSGTMNYHPVSVENQTNSSAGYKDLSAEFAKCSNNSSIGVNAASSTVPTVGQNFINSTNTFSAAGHSNTAEEGIDYEEVFAPVAWIEAIRLFLAYASFMGFMVYQMDVKSAFIDGTIEEQVYVCQPQGLRILIILIKYTKWSRHFMDYIKLQELAFCKSFEKLIKDRFQMSSIGEITFFLGLQVKQKKDGIFISQDKYVAKILRKFRLTEGKLASTPIDVEKPLSKDPDGEDVDVHTYKSMIGSLMYLTSSRPDIMLQKKVVISEAVIQDVLRLDDAKGVDCLLNEEIFTGLARMKYEKPSTKLTFYKAFFLSQWKFLIHTILRSMSAKRTSWNEFSSAMALAVICLSTGRKFNFSKYIFDSLVKNVDSSSKFYMYPRIRKGFSRVKTHLFEGMLSVRENVEADIREEQVPDDTVVAATTAAPEDVLTAVKKMERVNKVKAFKLRRLKKVRTSQRIDTSDDMEDVTSVSAASIIISAAEPNVPTATPTIVPVTAAYTRRRKGVIIRDLEEEYTPIKPAETKSKDKGKGIMIKEPKPMKKQDQVKFDAEYARKLHEELNKEIDWDMAIDHMKQKAKEDKTKAAKRRKLNEEAKEVKDLKQHLEIVPDEDDDVYTEATLLARKVPVVDYQIIQVNNKPRYKIIKADGTHQLYASFITML